MNGISMPEKKKKEKLLHEAENLVLFLCALSKFE